MHWFWLSLLGSACLELDALAGATLDAGAWLPDGHAVLITFFALFGRRRDFPLVVALLSGIRAIYSLEPFGGILLSTLAAGFPWLEARRWIPRERALTAMAVTTVISLSAGAARLLWPTAWLGGTMTFDLGTALATAATAGLLAPAALAVFRRWSAWSAFVAKDRVFG